MIHPNARSARPVQHMLNPILQRLFHPVALWYDDENFAVAAVDTHEVSGRAERDLATLTDRGRSTKR